MRSSRTLTFTFAVALFLAVCGTGDEPEGTYPSRNWSGRYGSRMVDSATDCSGEEEAPPLGGFFLELDHHPNNRATLRFNPLVGLTGEFQGDHLEAMGTVVAGFDPPGPAAGGTTGDSLDTTTYTLQADFRGVGFEGTYRIRTADVRAVAAGEGQRLCTHRYEISGQSLRSLSPEELEGDEAMPRPVSRGGRVGATDVGSR